MCNILDNLNPTSGQMSTNSPINNDRIINNLNMNNQVNDMNILKVFFYIIIIN